MAVAFSAYICALLFSCQLYFALYNVWHYLIKQGKWRIFSLAMFYILTIICVGLRIFICIFCVFISQYMNIALILFPAIVKICIGIVEIAVMFEISVRIKESINVMSSVMTSVLEQNL